jgi:hypothetical protein
MKRIAVSAAASLIVFVLAVAPAAAQAVAAETLTRAQMEEFLRTAKVVGAKKTSKGITQPWRLTLTNGTLTHDAAFQSIDQQRRMQTFSKGKTPELNFVDSWRFNVAAYRLAGLLGIGDMIPPTVERQWNSKQGALTWWANVLMDEEQRRKNAVKPPDPESWNRQNLTMRVFTELVYDTDRNLGNILITPEWKLVMIDFTRAFRSWNETRAPVATLRRVDRQFLAAMRALTEDALENEVNDYLTGFETRALLKRRDLIVRHFDDLVAKLGENVVLY